jgi:hypothetical protein
MTKSRSLIYLLVALTLITVGIVVFQTNQEPARIFQATVVRDCAPWDGSAFRVTIPMSDGNNIDISIWKSPDIKIPVTFSFPDDTGQVGNASYRSATDEYKQLSGTVFFWNVNEGSQVKGKFELTAEDGQQFEGQFEAEWNDQIALCG